MIGTHVRGASKSQSPTTAKTGNPTRLRAAIVIVTIILLLLLLLFGGT